MRVFFIQNCRGRSSAKTKIMPRFSGISSRFISPNSRLGSVLAISMTKLPAPSFMFVVGRGEGAVVGESQPIEASRRMNAKAPRRQEEKDGVMHCILLFIPWHLGDLAFIDGL